MTLEEKWLVLRSRFPAAMPEAEVATLRMVFMCGVSAAAAVLMAGSDGEVKQFMDDVVRLAFEVQPAHGEERPM